MSTTTSALVAMKYGLVCSEGKYQSMLLFKLRTESFMERGASIQFISAFPQEEEVLFAPLTYLRPTDKEQAVFHLPSAGNTLTVVEVNPRG